VRNQVKAWAVVLGEPAALVRYRLDGSRPRGPPARAAALRRPWDACCVTNTFFRSMNLPNQAPDLLHLFQLLFRRRLSRVAAGLAIVRVSSSLHRVPTTHRTPAAGVLRGGAKGDDARHRGRHPPGKPLLRRANVLACCRLPVGKRCVRHAAGLFCSVSPHARASFASQHT